MSSRRTESKVNLNRYDRMIVNIENEVSEVIKCAFRIAAFRALRRNTIAKRSLSIVTNRLSHQWPIVRQIIRARKAVDFLESTGDLDGARALFNPLTSWSAHNDQASNSQPLTIKPDELLSIAIKSKSDIDDILRQASEEMRDPYLQKLAICTGARVAHEVGAWDIEAQKLCQEIADNWNLSDYNFSNWYENLAHPIVTGAPVSHSAILTKVKNIAQDMEDIVERSGDELTVKEMNDVEDLISAIKNA